MLLVPFCQRLGVPGPEKHAAYACCSAHPDLLFCWKSSVVPAGWLADQDGPEVVDIGAGWPGDQQVANRLEGRIGIIVGQRRQGINAGMAQTRGRAAIDK